MDSTSPTVAFVVPMGPTCNPAFVRDTLESIIAYSTEPHRIYLGCHESVGESAKIACSGLETVRIWTHTNTDGHGGKLLYNLSALYAYAMDESPFETLIRLDTDALAIGKGFDTDIMEYFRHNSSVGLAGKLEFARRGTHDSVTQQILDSATYKVYLIRPRRPQAMFAKFGLMTTLSRALKEGEKRGYRLAEYVFGGSYAFSRSCLEALRSNGHLPNKNLIWTDLSEDYLFGLLVRTAGFELGSLNGARLPFHVAHRQLPLSPEELRSCGAKVIHSVRRFNDRNESQIREFFRQYRE